MDKTKKFTLEAARAMIPWIREATREAESKVFEVQRNAEDRHDALAQVNRIIQHWGETVAKLGAIPKQPFLVDFESGEDYFCWEYPEKTIIYRHGYHKGYAGRQKIEE